MSDGNVLFLIITDSDSQIKKITIRQSAEKPQATVDDIKASVMSLRLQPVSQGMRKATSSQSLNGKFVC